MKNFKWDDNSLNHLNPDLVFLGGFTKPDINSFGKVPVLRDKFTLQVTIGTILLIQ